ncbi:MAG TPA: SsrA-binding protein SmpB [Planctomycetaceae bacterium]|nr:SsrA-binding protein SmpB [Planctomycetaceae bacterium]
MPQKKKNKSKSTASKPAIVCRNRKARYQYDLLDELECGIVLQGSEVKSIRNGKMSIDEAYVRVRGDELWLVGSHVAEYPPAALANHDPVRPRKLLAHKRQIQKFAQAAEQKGLTLIPLSVYFSRDLVKVRIAIARGRKLHDKREKLRKEADRREMRQQLARRR